MSPPVASPAFRSAALARRLAQILTAPLTAYIPASAATLAIVFVAAPASADPQMSFGAATAAASRPAPVQYAQGLNLGGGFIEYLFSGGSAAPPAHPQQGYAATGADPGARIDPRYERQTVPYDGEEKPGTVIINTNDKLLYLVEPGQKALRYGIGVGRPGFTWAGVKHVSMKREWPDWRPPADMLKRKPDLPHFMTGGPENPLGARALYLGSSLYRIHGSNEPWTIGTQVSSGCIRMRNEDVIDLYDRVPVGAKVMVM
jgi:lipoprotein-anchoring transpeptidase ErfK/SrfK